MTGWKFAHSEHCHKKNVRCQRDDTAALLSHPANMPGAKWYLAEWRKTRGMSQTALAKEAETSKGYISELESGQRPIPPGAMLQRLATALDVEPHQLVAEDPSGKSGRPKRVKLVGYVGAGAEAHYYTMADDPAEEVDAPENATKDTVAAEVRGTSLGPAFERWLVYYDDVRSPVTPDLHGQLCVVGTEDQILVKILRPAEGEGRFHLISNFGEEPLFNRAVEWAAKVKSMRPR
jgi:transcriptional regulator with XRE-family HTH domain